MRIAVLCDVHGCLVPLEAVLDEVERESVDAIVLGGDSVAGPRPAETLARLRELGDRALWLRGNADREPAEWVAGQLSAADLEFLASLPDVQRLDVDGLGRTLFCHGSPRSDEEILTAVTPTERLREILADVRERVVVCGHTHHQFDREVDRWRLVNAGSVGMAYEGRPGAHWALLGSDVDFRRTVYDVERAERDWLASGYPDAAEVAETLFRSTPSADEVAEHFERMASEAT